MSAQSYVTLQLKTKIREARPKRVSHHITSRLLLAVCFGYPEPQRTAFYALGTGLSQLLYVCIFARVTGGICGLLGGFGSVRFGYGHG